ncbi:MAG: lysophospholipid acyltransferase family protein [Fidelibacterota bacterium]
MNSLVIVIALLALVFVGVTISVVSRVESHSEKPSAVAQHKLGFLYTVVSVILWPLGLLSFVVGVVILIPLLFLIPPKYLSLVIRLFCRFVLLSVGVVVRVKGKERFRRSKAFVVMFNHQSLFDAFVLGVVIYRYMTALGAAYQFKLPLWGTLLRRWEIIPIPRTNLTQAIRSIELAREKLDSGIPVLVAPEGTRTLTGEIGEFKKGPFHLALGSKADILPMVIQGAFEIKQKTDWRLKPGIVRVNTGNFITLEQYRGLSVEELRNYVRVRLRELAGEIP